MIAILKNLKIISNKLIFRNSYRLNGIVDMLNKNLLCSMFAKINTQNACTQNKKILNNRIMKITFRINKKKKKKKKTQNYS